MTLAAFLKMKLWSGKLDAQSAAAVLPLGQRRLVALIQSPLEACGFRIRANQPEC